MKAVEAVLKVASDGSAVVTTGKPLKPGQHKILIITDESAIFGGKRELKQKKQLLDLKPVHVKGWPKNATFRREEIYNDDGR
ncbi:MAG: hypothetical protein COX19_05945 [Desulfobacterales bacterium CG23_combo_of_CG06-09_8_20_14_all_51_8]|nr:MAG: hypothetical protein COX19_05945 [Desulfobacterales bacterium CG23_combo_of_CG06-09_8_20_14_all_51_8]